MTHSSLHHSDLDAPIRADHHDDAQRIQAQLDLHSEAIRSTVAGSVAQRRVNELLHSAAALRIQTAAQAQSLQSEVLP